MSSAKKFLHGFFKALDYFSTFVSIFSLILLIAMIMLQIILRYVFKSPLFGIEESEVFPMLWLYCGGAMIASNDRTHISCGLAGVIFKDQRRLAIADCVKDFITFILSFVGLYIIYPHFTYINSVHKTTVSLNLPTLYCECAFMVALTIMVLYTLRDFIKSLEALKMQKRGEA